MSVKRPYKGDHICDIINDYTVIDIETTSSNPANCEILELAAVRVRNNEIVETFNSLIKPPVPIPEPIIELTGITNDMVSCAPTVDKEIEKYLSFIGDDIILGHNIYTFDVNVIYDICVKLGLSTFSNNMLDTFYFAQHCNIDVPNLKLSTLTMFFEIEHEHAHRALHDCIANHECYQKLKTFYDKDFRFKYKDKVPRKSFVRLSENTKQLETLRNISLDMVNNGNISDIDVLALNKWLETNAHLAGNFPFDLIFRSVKDILDDGIITPDEKKYLIDLLEDFCDPISSCSEIVEEINVNGMNIILTGDFLCGTRPEIQEMLENLGAKIKSSVSSKTDYVIVGELKSKKWAHGSYGNKVKKALEFQQTGKNIKIIKEGDFFKCLIQN